MERRVVEAWEREVRAVKDWVAVQVLAEERLRETTTEPVLGETVRVELAAVTEETTPPPLDKIQTPFTAKHPLAILIPPAKVEVALLVE